jgi:hypothetical protein
MEDYHIVTAYSDCTGSEDKFADCTSTFNYESNIVGCDHS